jgi:hypothetical protein
MSEVGVSFGSHDQNHFNRKGQAAKMSKDFRQKMLPNSYLSGHRFRIFLSAAVFIVFYHLFLSASGDPLPPFMELCASYGAFIAGCIALSLRIKYYYEKRDILYTRILILISTLWLFFNVNFYFGYPIGLFLFMLLMAPCVCLYFSHKENFALLYLIIISFFCLFAIIGKIWIAGILMVLFGITTRITKNFDPSKRGAAEVSIYFSFVVERPYGFLQGAGTGFLFLYVYALEWIKISFPLQLTLWGIFLWNLMTTVIYFYAVLECNKEVVFSEVEIQQNSAHDNEPGTR